MMRIRFSLFFLLDRVMPSKSYQPRRAALDFAREVQLGQPAVASLRTMGPVGCESFGGSLPGYLGGLEADA